ncbi:MAG: alpha/beta fold hydrolase [Desulfobacteraceae bacterium]|nr:alpha/beta fold hydrolase [Desulfobacteraceae bacterium]
MNLVNKAGYQISYKSPFLLNNAHVQTIIPSAFRKTSPVFYKRERVETTDNDFIDLDWSIVKSKKLAIISHGLEGNSNRKYVKGMVNALNKNGWDALAFNFRGCSGEPNRLLKSYHSGYTEDIALTIKHARQQQRYNEIALIGFSIGGNMTLVYLGRDKVDPIVKKAGVLSVPCHLEDSSACLAKFKNTIYMKRFLRMFHNKIKEKMALMPGQIDDKDFNKIKNFKDFDDRYTAPIHGFKNAVDYWKKCSSKQFIPNIKIPTLIINAKDDPFLSNSCYPIKESENNKNVTLDMPESGGHVGFITFNKEKIYWSEQRIVDFIS